MLPFVIGQGGMVLKIPQMDLIAEQVKPQVNNGAIEDNTGNVELQEHFLHTTFIHF